MDALSIVILAVAVVCIILLLAGIVLTFMSNKWAVVAAYVGMLGIGLTVANVTYTSLIFWGVATVIVLILQFLLPKGISSSRRGVGYIAGAALAGALAGLTVSHGWMIIGSVIGAALGGVAYSRTPAGKVMEFPSSKFLNYLCAKGLPAVVTMCIAGSVILWLAAIMTRQTL
ncbi:MAG: hypothetical protein NC411_06075 [Bacteroides sp.]|nr:hypothetical protein [Bacteroides sp.]